MIKQCVVMFMFVWGVFLGGCQTGVMEDIELKVAGYDIESAANNVTSFFLGLPEDYPDPAKGCDCFSPTEDIKEQEYGGSGCFVQYTYYLDEQGNEVRHGKAYQVLGWDTLTEVDFVHGRIDGEWKVYFYDYKKGALAGGPVKVVSIDCDEYEYYLGMRDFYGGDPDTCPGLRVDKEACGDDLYLLFEAHFDDGVLNGELTRYYVEGGVKNKAMFKDGKLVGTSRYYDEQGQIVRESQYEQGQLVSMTATQYRNGQPYQVSWRKADGIVHWGDSDVAEDVMKEARGELKIQEEMIKGEGTYEYKPYYVDENGVKVRHGATQTTIISEDENENEEGELVCKGEYNYCYGFKHGCESFHGDYINEYVCAYVLDVKQGIMRDKSGQVRYEDSWYVKDWELSRFGFWGGLEQTIETWCWSDTFSWEERNPFGYDLSELDRYFRIRYDVFGMRVEDWVWYLNGQLARQGCYQRGRKHGVWKKWDRMGNLVSENEWRNGKPWTGVFKGYEEMTRFYDNGIYEKGELIEAIDEDE